MSLMNSEDFSLIVLTRSIKNKKCIVFFSSCNCVKCIVFPPARQGTLAENLLPTDHSELLNYIDLPV